jgi:hypothetical protein
MSRYYCALAIYSAFTTFQAADVLAFVSLKVEDVSGFVSFRTALDSG